MSNEMKKFPELSDYFKENGVTDVRPINSNFSKNVFILDCAGHQRVMKILDKGNIEIEIYKKILPHVGGRASFTVFQSPKMLGQFDTKDSTFLFLEYIRGETFDFCTNDMNLTSEMVDLVGDLKTINLQDPIFNKPEYDYAKVEKKFWKSFDLAFSVGLIDNTKKVTYRGKAIEILAKAKDSIELIFSNYDFNPRNIIRTEDSRLVLIDWNHMIAPLEHHLVYPWLINFRNYDWLTNFVKNFEKKFGFCYENTRYNLMTFSMNRARMEYKYYNGGENIQAYKRAQNHIKKFEWSLGDYKSLNDYPYEYLSDP